MSKVNIKSWMFLSAYLLLPFPACNSSQEKKTGNETNKTLALPSLTILGTLQDGGSPHAGCKKNCCVKLFNEPDPARQVVCLGLADPSAKQAWLFEATPDMGRQMKTLKEISGIEKETPDGIFLTHAHIGHYAGLIYLGREAMNSKTVTVHALPRMKSFLENNGPWSQLVKLGNIRLNGLQENKDLALSPSFTVNAFTVPHRDEFSETVGYSIKGPHKKALFIPDIDKWEKWERNCIEEIAKVDYAFIDGTFFDAKEINNRNIKEIPHPFISESMELFKALPPAEKAKIYFIHFNHTNPLLDAESAESRQVRNAGFNIAKKDLVISM